VLKDLCRRYDKVVFIDDDPKNVANAKALGIKNLTVIAV
jgi:FMN phosphatase YigB (HAD superfamily)